MSIFWFAETICPILSRQCQKPVSRIGVLPALICFWMVRWPKPGTRFTSFLRAKKSGPIIRFRRRMLRKVKSSARFRLLSLEALVRMKLTSFRDKDRTHLRNLIDVGLIQADWPNRFPPELGSRLKNIIDNPDG